MKSVFSIHLYFISFPVTDFLLAKSQLVKSSPTSNWLHSFSPSIIKSFVIDNNKNLNLVRGTKLHEQFRLIFKRTRFQDIQNKFTNFNEKQTKFLLKINSCELIYSGHN